MENKMKFYKFRSCNEDSFAAFWNNQIYASRMEDFNDPFEGWCWEDDRADLLEKQEMKEQVMEARRRFGRRAFYCVCSSNEEDFVCKNLYMWAHYANSHRGFCIEYNDGLLKGLMKDGRENSYVAMKYSDERPDSPSYCGKCDNDKYMLDLLRTKSSDWEKENEIRLIFKDAGLKKIDKEVISAIYLGCCILNNDRWILEGMAREKGIACYKMEMDKQYYRLEKRNI